MARASYSSHTQDRSSKIDQMVPGFSGLNNSDDPSSNKVQDTDLVDALNIVYDSAGSTETRPGSLKLLTTSLAGPILGLHPFYYAPSSLKQIIYGSVAAQYRYDNAGGSTSIGTGFGSGKRWEYATSKGKTYGCNGDGLYKYTGSGSVTLVTAARTFVAIKFYKNRLYGVEANSSILWFSDAGNPESFPAGNFIEINTDDGQIITALNGDIDEFIIGKSESIWLLTGEPLGAGATTTIGNLQLRKAKSEVGPVSHRAMVSIARGTQLFAASDGLYVLQGVTARNISEEIAHTFQTDMNQSFLNLCYAVYNKTQKKFLLGYPSTTSTVCDKMIMLDLAKPSEAKYAIWDNLPGSCAINFKFAEGKESVLIGHPTKGFIYELFKGYFDIANDHGTATAGGASTLTDSTKAWATNSLTDAAVRIIAGKGRGQRRYVTSNTGTVITLDAAWSVTPDSTSVYTVGGYLNYGDTKIFDQRKPALDKKFKFWDLFTDAMGNYDLKVDVAYNYDYLGYFSDSTSLTTGALLWGQIDPDTGVRMKWGKVGKRWGGKRRLHRRIELGGEQAKQIQGRFGNDMPNQPWRLSKYVFTYKEKKNRPD